MQFIDIQISSHSGELYWLRNSIKGRGPSPKPHSLHKLERGKKWLFALSPLEITPGHPLPPCFHPFPPNPNCRRGGGLLPIFSIVRSVDEVLNHAVTRPRSCYGRLQTSAHKIAIPMPWWAEMTLDSSKIKATVKGELRIFTGLGA